MKRFLVWTWTMLSRCRSTHVITREQILVAMRLSTLGKKSSNREGLALNKELNTEALFINLKKSEEDFSPTTLYDDYAINELLSTGSHKIKRLIIRKKVCPTSRK
ncbi:DUF3427 domain-containing protein [Sphingobacterium corticibacterium]|uniref:DUF3427 domain-containing protein n=1 Tax=Sphingobacterium corticibacterium TaxID=2484746 RepID=UPI0019CFB582|nr:DUF3427 domain-containing protein [Sphingobacterium corticibacterium]